MKKIVLPVIAGIVVLVSSLSLLRIDKYRPNVEQQLSSALGRKVTIAKLGVRLFPPSIRITGLAIAEPAGFPATPFISAEEVYASANPFGVLTGSPKVDELRLSKPRVQIVRNAQGKWNFANLGATGSSGSSSSSFSLGSLSILDGIVSLSDQLHPDQASDFDHINLTVEDFSTAAPFKVTASLHLPGKDGASFALRATAGPLNPASAALTPLDAHLTLQQVSIADLSDISNSQEFSHYKGEVSGTVDVRLDKGNLTAGGALSTSHLKINQVEIPFPLNLSFKILGNLPASSYEITPLDLQLDRQHFTLTGKTAAQGDRTALDLLLNIPPSSIAELGHLAGVMGASTGVDARGTVFANVHINGTADAPLLSGVATINDAFLKPTSLTKPIEIRHVEVKFDQDSFALKDLNAGLASSTLKGNIAVKNLKRPEATFALQADTINVAELESLAIPAKTAPAAPKSKGSTYDSFSAAGTLELGSILTGGLELDKVRTTASFDHGVLKLTQLSGDLFGGTATGSMHADLRPKNPAFSLQLALNSISANNLLTAVSAAKDTLFGTLSAKTNLQFTVTPDGDIIRSLNGTLGFNLANGKLRNLDMINELGKIAKFTGATPPQGNETPIKKLAGDLQFTNGTANTSNLTGEIPQGGVAAKGSVNLVNQALDMKLTATLATGPSKSFGGQLVGGLMSTVIASKNGELIIPTNVKGTTAKPVITPDLEAMAKLKLGAIANPAQKAAGALGGLIKGLGKK